MGCRCWLDASSVPLQIILPSLLLLCVASRPSLPAPPPYCSDFHCSCNARRSCNCILRLLYLLTLALQPADGLCSSEKQLCCSKYSSQASAAAQNILTLLLLKMFSCCSKYLSAAAVAQNILLLLLLLHKIFILLQLLMFAFSGL